MSRLVFVTTELYPESPGGAGVLIDDLAHRLERPVDIALFATTPTDPVDRPGVGVRVYPLDSADFLARSKSIAETVSTTIAPNDQLEFHDFEGIGFWALSHRYALGLESVPISVRFHGPYDLIAESLPSVPTDWGLPRAMEAECFRMADRVIVPVSGHRSEIVDRYGLDAERVVVGPPPVRDLGRLTPQMAPVVIASLGRLSEVKGSDDLIRAAVALLDEGLEFRVRLIGDDGWSSTADAPMRQWLEGMIGDRHRESFEFLPPVPRDQVRQALSGVTAVVAPSRFESFCLSAHEARKMGLPVVVPDIAAFSRVLTSATGALVYRPGLEGLTVALRSVVQEPQRVIELARAATTPDMGDPLAVYAVEPTLRHPRSQAGLATAATQRVEQFLAPVATTSPLLQRVYRSIPTPAARLAARLLPRSWKDRARSHASWPEEEARRARESRLGAIETRLQRGEFPDLTDPDVTVVIPVYNDAGYLEETLASVYEQSHDSWEIIVVDDGSTDPDTIETLDLLDRPRLTVIRQQNSGLPGARNAGISKARGKYLIPLDADDELAPSFMEEMLAAIQTNPRAAFAHCYTRLHHDIEALWMSRPFNPYWQLLGNGVVGCVLMRKEAVDAVGGYDRTMTKGNEDWELWVRFIAEGWEQVQVMEPLFRYRKHGVSMSVSTESRFEEGRRAIRDRHPELYNSATFSEMKSRHYPLVTALVDTAPDPEADFEFIESVEELGKTWGKFVVDSRGLRPFPHKTILALADTLERDDRIESAETNGEPPLVVRRRWNLHDRGADAKQKVVLEDSSIGPHTELPGYIPRRGWEVPAGWTKKELMVQRQPPEEAGRLPETSSW